MKRYTMRRRPTLTCYQHLRECIIAVLVHHDNAPMVNLLGFLTLENNLIVIETAEIAGLTGASTSMAVRLSAFPSAASQRRTSATANFNSPVSLRGMPMKKGGQGLNSGVTNSIQVLGLGSCSAAIVSASLLLHVIPLTHRYPLYSVHI